MRDSVRNAFLDFTRPLEGVVPWMYCDVKGLVSIGIGNLIDPIRLAMGLPFVRPDGTLATQSEIAAEWLRIKSTLGAATGGHLFVKDIAKLRLTDEGIRHLVGSKLNQNDAFMRQRFPSYESWPADAQLGVMSMCWAVGPAFQRTWPRFTMALEMLDFEMAAAECFMPEEKTISGLRPRNKADALLFRNAEQVILRQLNPDILYWPKDLTAPVGNDDTTQEQWAIVHPLVPLESPELNDDDEPPSAA